MLLVPVQPRLAADDDPDRLLSSDSTDLAG
jgi:hypothetical protein